MIGLFYFLLIFLLHWPDFLFLVGAGTTNDTSVDLMSFYQVAAPVFTLLLLAFSS